jgi:hypothetical protein
MENVGASQDLEQEELLPVELSSSQFTRMETASRVRTLQALALARSLLAKGVVGASLSLCIGIFRKNIPSAL